MGFLCEYCLGRIDLTLAEYEEAHRRVVNEDVTEKRDTYEIAQKG